MIANNLPRIIVCTYDQSLHNLLLITFEGSGYRIVAVHSRDQARMIVERDGLPDIVILDTDPQYHACGKALKYFKFLRQTSELPMLLLSAASDVENLIPTAKALGADFMYKPVVVPELRFRLQRLVQDAPRRAARRLTYDIGKSVRADFHDHIVLHGRDMVTLSNLENKLLYMLVQDAQVMVQASRLANRLWGESYDQQHKLRALVRRLRRKLNPVLGEKCIEAVPGVGYCFTLPVTAVQANTPVSNPIWH